MVIDPTVLEQIVDLDRQSGGGLLDELAGLFVYTTPARFTAVAQGLASGDRATVEREIHSMRGSAGALGAADFMQAAGALEPLARAGRLDEVAAGMPGLQRSFDEAVTTLVAELAVRGIHLAPRS
jgi:HPt (histidine-containing phosphotransfer) domain-containing protein